VDEVEIGRQVVWIEETNINRYPKLLQGSCTLPFLIDPYFRRYIDVDFQRGELVIKSVKKVDTKVGDDIYIPKGLLSLEKEFELFGSKYSQKN